MLYNPSCVQSTKGHNLYEVEDKAAEEIVLGARKHLFLCNNLFSVMNHVRDMIDKADEAINGKVREKDYIYYILYYTLLYYLLCIVRNILYYILSIMFILLRSAL